MMLHQGAETKSIRMQRKDLLTSILKQVREVVPGFKEFEFTFSGSDRVAFSMG
jgi:hypothetical protein